MNDEERQYLKKHQHDWIIATMMLVGIFASGIILIELNLLAMDFLKSSERFWFFFRFASLTIVAICILVLLFLKSKKQTQYQELQNYKPLNPSRRG